MESFLVELQIGTERTRKRTHLLSHGLESGAVTRWSKTGGLKNIYTLATMR